MCRASGRRSSGHKGLPALLITSSKRLFLVQASKENIKRCLGDTQNCFRCSLRYRNERLLEVKVFISFQPCMNSDQRLSYLHLMNKAAESEDRQSYFYYLKLAEQTLQRQDPEALWKPAG